VNIILSGLVTLENVSIYRNLFLNIETSSVMFLHLEISMFLYVETFVGRVADPVGHTSNGADMDVSIFRHF